MAVPQALSTLTGSACSNMAVDSGLVLTLLGPAGVRRQIQVKGASSRVVGGKIRHTTAAQNSVLWGSSACCILYTPRGIKIEGLSLPAHHRYAKVEVM